MKNEELNKYSEKAEKIWKDLKHICGLPLSFTSYSMSCDRLFIKKGLLFEHENELLLYRIKDLTVKRTFWQKICGVGTVVVTSLDTSTPVLYLINIKKPNAVKEMLHDYTEKAKQGATIEQILG